MTINVSREIIDTMLVQAEQAYPCECCGFVVGEMYHGVAQGYYYRPCDNSKSDNRERRFLIDPEIYQEAEDLADREGLSIISVVHSHPDHPDQPSEFDRTHAWPGFSYIIISVILGKVVGYRSWQLTEDREQFVEEDLIEINLESRVSRSVKINRSLNL